jgi:hypothetical protein
VTTLFDIDAISMTASADRPPHQVTGELVSPNPSAEATSLMRYLAANYGMQQIARDTASRGLEIDVAAVEP